MKFVGTSKYSVGDVLKVMRGNGREFVMTVEAVVFSVYDGKVRVEYVPKESEDIPDESEVLGRMVMEKEVGVDT